MPATRATPISSSRFPPAARDRLPALRTATLSSDMIAQNPIAAALHQHRLAMRAARVLEVADGAWKIAGVDVAQPCFAADSGGAQQVARRGAVVVSHFVI